MTGWAEMLSHWPDVPLSYNVAPSSAIAAFYSREREYPEGSAMRWGLVPAWSKTFDSKYATFNARLESVADKATYRSAWKHKRRCLIPMAGYYEWQAAADGNETPRSSHSGGKQPFYITDRNVGGLVVAGLFESWRPASGDAEESAIERRLSCTMITRPADPVMEKLHHRMPVFLTPETATLWLDATVDEAQRLLETVESPELVYWPVGRAVGNVRNDDQRLCEPVDI